jgi:hypothetical protein
VNISNADRVDKVQGKSGSNGGGDDIGREQTVAAVSELRVKILRVIDPCQIQFSREQISLMPFRGAPLPPR